MIETIFSEFRANAQDVVAVTVCLAAIVWGGGPERVVAAAWLFVFEFVGRVQDWLYGAGVQLEGIDWFVASQDACVGLIFVMVALNANRNYTLWIAGMQVLAVTAHLARSLADLIAPIAYAVMFIVPGWLQLVLLAVGLARHLRRKRRYGQYRDWRVGKSAVRLGGTPPFFAGGAQQPSWRDDLK